MPELDFQDLEAGFTFRDVSPDSVIFTAESNFSVFSSASGSVDRCSFASDGPDQDSVVSQNLAGHGLSGLLSGPADPDQNKPTLLNKKSVSHSKKEKAKVQKLDSYDAETTVDENIAADSGRNSFSQALRVCQERRLRSVGSASVDLNNTVANAVSSSSPRFGVMNKPRSSTYRTGTFPSPGTPNYRHSSVGIQKGWSSERIPLHNSTNRRNVNAALLPYNNGNGRALPSKWEDAERWIFSPMSGDSSVRTSFQQLQTRPKSKSGPLGPPDVSCHQMFSPAREDSRNIPSRTEPCMARSISIHGYAERVNHSSGQPDDSYDGAEDSANDVSRAVSRRDMATQMSPESSMNSSPGRISSFSLATPSILPIVLVEPQRMRPSGQETRDVAIDERVTMTRWSKKSWIVSAETSNSISKVQREEAKIAAWENLQKAKAEAAVRKLEMKLEKKRSSSMDKIMKKLRFAQKKAQDMRSSMMTNQATCQVATASDQTLSIRRRTRHIGYFSGCFTCHAF